MKKLPITADAGDIFSFCEEWLAALSDRNFTKAANMLYDSGEYDEPITAFLLESNLGPDCNLSVSAQNDEENPRKTMRAYSDEAGKTATVLHPTLPIEINWNGLGNVERPTFIGTVVVYHAINNEWTSSCSEFFIHRLDDCIGIELRTFAE